MCAYDGDNRIYFTKDGTGRVYYLELNSNNIELYGVIPGGHGVAIIGNRMVMCQTSEGFKFLYMMRHSGTELFRTSIVF
jgi:hypothetical protein